MGRPRPQTVASDGAGRCAQTQDSLCARLCPQGTLTGQSTVPSHIEQALPVGREGAKAGHSCRPAHSFQASADGQSLRPVSRAHVCQASCAHGAPALLSPRLPPSLCPPVPTLRLSDALDAMLHYPWWNSFSPTPYPAFSSESHPFGNPPFIVGPPCWTNRYGPAAPPPLPAKTGLSSDLPLVRAPAVGLGPALLQCDHIFVDYICSDPISKGGPDMGHARPSVASQGAA
ncbi:hypothetical protein J1605_014923 [Eschrichtius robustus]|uniref:Uncharacterized protein n=1 Tax=Eschrichtius robustus TaxID=9764 RepID=A0AB34GBC9_ESCRO|nr:hypothetical protein J1605_014923 [Eschrichtius robustus]